jgi:hypothetical protein
MTKSLILALFSSSLFFFSYNAHAGRISNCSGGSGDYSDAPASYGVACHDTNRWQQFGDAEASLPGDYINIDDFNNPEWSAESAPLAIDSGDGGVSWATSNDGVNWGPFGRSDDLVRGEFVKFKVDIQRSDEGNHQFDEYKLWLDWFGAGSFDDSDVVMNGRWFKDQDTQSNVYNGVRTHNYFNHDLNTFNSPEQFGSFFSQMIQVPLTAMLGEVWMRARVTCENSFNHWNQFALHATGYYHQGEVEDYALRIVQHVSAPMGAGLLAIGVVGAMLLRRRRTKANPLRQALSAQQQKQQGSKL